MRHLWAPWRMNYVVGSKPDGCVFCGKTEDRDDAENHVLYRGEYNFVLLNAYPYNSGHVMVVPYKHASCLTELDSATVSEMFSMAQALVGVMKSYLHAEGVNLGMNIGQAAGAGIEAHLHLHLLPRWSGDTNYMTSIGGTRIVPQSLDETYMSLQPVVNDVLDQLKGSKSPCAD